MSERIMKVLANMPQGLSEEQKSQARENIGAVSASEIPSAQVNADWDATSGISQILNRPNLSVVATTGLYSDLINKPGIPAQMIIMRKATDTSNVVRYAKVAELTPSTGSYYVDTYDFSFVCNGPVGSSADIGEYGLFHLGLQCRQDTNVYYTTGSWPLYRHYYYAETDDPYRNVYSVIVLKQMEHGSGGQNYLRKVEVWLKLWTGFSDHDDVSISFMQNTGVHQYRSSYPSKSENWYPWQVTTGTVWATTTAPTGNSTEPYYVETEEYLALDTAQVNADWDATSGVSQILNKPTLAAVATSGSYTDLSDTPTIPTVPTIDLMTYAESVSIEAGQFVNPATYSLNKYIPVGQKFYGTLSIQVLYSTSQTVYQFELGSNSNTLTCNFGDYAASRQSGHVIPIYVDNTSGSAPVQLFFTLQGTFESQTLNCKVQGITIG